MSYIVVFPLAELQAVVAEHGALDLVTLINAETEVLRPETILPDRHLFLGFNDIDTPVEGLTAPTVEHLDAFLDFARRWDRHKPLAIHCWAGISRSTAAAYIAAIAINPSLDEVALANELRRRAPSATPNRRLIALADEKLGRGGRMIEAISGIGRGEEAFSGTPFVLPLEL